MNLLGNGLSDAKHHEAALSVRETDLATRRRLGADEESILITQNNLANTYQTLGWLDEALQLKRDVYSGHLRLWGEENIDTLDTCASATQCALACKIVALLVALVAAVG